MVSKTGAAKSFAKQLGWQEAITKLFILHPLQNSCDRNSDQDDTRNLDHDDLITMSENDSKGSLMNFYEGYYEGDNSPRSEEPHKGENSKGSDNSENCSRNQNDSNCDNAKDVNLIEFSEEVSPNVQENTPLIPNQSVINEIKHAFKPDVHFSLDLNKDSNLTLPDATLSPQTPLYLKRQFEDLLSEEDVSQGVSRSSSASAEDLSAIGQRQAEQSHDSKESESATVIHKSESDFNFENDGIVLRRESLSSSQITYSRSMMDSLGLRGSFLMESVEDSEELCQNLLIVLLTIMWKGVEGSDKTAWQVGSRINPLLAFYHKCCLLNYL